MNIMVKAKVQCTDGLFGEVTHVIVHPTTKKVTRLVVKEGRFPHVERMVPLRFVSENTDELIELKCTKEELSKMQPYFRTVFVETGSSHYGEPQPTGRAVYANPNFKKVKKANIAEDETIVDVKTRVRATDGEVGRVEQFAVELTSGSITNLILRQGRLWPQKEVAIPADEIERFGSKNVFLKTNQAKVKSLPAVSTPNR